MSQSKIELTATKFSPRQRFVSQVTKSQHISDPINISIEHCGDILISANFNASIKSRFFNSCFTLWPLIFGHIFGTHKKLLTFILILRNGFNFSSSTTLCVMNVCCDLASNNDFIAQTCFIFICH